MRGEFWIGCWRGNFGDWSHCDGATTGDLPSELSRDKWPTAASPQRGHLLPKLADLNDAIRTQVTARPDATLAELRAWLAKTYQVSVSDGLMWKTLAALNLTHKKGIPGERPGPSGRHQEARREA